MKRILMLIVFGPIYIVLKVVEWLISLTQLLSGWIFRLLGIIILLIAFASWGFGLETKAEIIRIATTGVVIFAIPLLWELITAIDIVLEFLVERAIKQ